ncbi:hypothetical protein BHE74_00020046 [Ensete ventricosum]|nr:hypothetical protein BHE74_00020046 [Ensete ventricosum]
MASIDLICAKFEAFEMHLKDNYALSSWSLDWANRQAQVDHNVSYSSPVSIGCMLCSPLSLRNLFEKNFEKDRRKGYVGTVTNHRVEITAAKGESF